MSDKKEELLTLRQHMSSSTPVFGGVSVAHLLSFSCCPSRCLYGDVCNEFRIKKILGSFLPPVVCRRVHVLVYLLCILAHSDVQYLVLSIVSMFWVACRDVRYDFQIKTMSVRLYLQLGLSLICGGMPIVVSNTHCIVFLCFICLSLRPVCTILSVYLNGPFLIVPSVFFNVYFMLSVL